VADLDQQTVRWFPETQFLNSSPLLDGVTGEIYWANPSGIWKRSLEEEPRLVNRFSAGVTKNRSVTRYATHLTLSADRKALNIDAVIGDETLIGQAPLNGDEIEIWQRIERNYDHAQFHPKDSELVLLAQENEVDRRTGAYRQKDNRLWLIRRGGELFPVYPHAPSGPYEATTSNSHLQEPVKVQVADPRAMHGHEWWSASGDIWYIHYQTGVEKVPVGETTPTLVWPHRTVSHAHLDPSERYLVLDALPSEKPEERQVTFANLATGRSVDIVSSLPVPHPELKKYHIHPHPQFCGQHGVIAYTTTVLGSVDVAFTLVDDLIRVTGDAAS
jgi:hypothetical protein